MKKIQNGKSLIKRQDQSSNHIKRSDNNCHITDVVKAFSHEEVGGSITLFYS